MDLEAAIVGKIKSGRCRQDVHQQIQMNTEVATVTRKSLRLVISTLRPTRGKRLIVDETASGWPYDRRHPNKNKFALKVEREGEDLTDSGKAFHRFIVDGLQWNIFLGDEALYIVVDPFKIFRECIDIDDEKEVPKDEEDYQRSCQVRLGWDITSF
ncbi:hypothetical protein DPMN_165953 [Dreissena polymorpha]|uniref:Uncharacterized protein n=1 Tax=Dreissena polymorpha TaxID=45954 RepID=A0A9D4EVY0_DREPO|nr:hypothetical protein DPMN_165953 [Dreissena polymorpha]